MLEMMLSSFLVGFIVAVPPGAVTVVAAQKSILYGFKNSLLFTAGSCIADIFYILLVFYGIAPLYSQSHLFKIIFWYAGSVLLFYFGYDALRAVNKNLFSTDVTVNEQTVTQNIVSGVLITLLNPMTIGGWMVIAGGFFTHWREEWPPILDQGMLSIISMMAGVLCWFIPLIFMISKAKKVLNRKAIKWLIFFSGVFFIGLGIYSIFSATTLLLAQ